MPESVHSFVPVTDREDGNTMIAITDGQSQLVSK
jgi:hypothetical protein